MFEARTTQKSQAWKEVERLGLAKKDSPESVEQLAQHWQEKESGRRAYSTTETIKGYLKNWIVPAWGSRVLLAQVGGPSDIRDLRRLITADSIRYREMRAAWLKGDRSGDNVGYVVLYMSAVMAADPEHGDEVLLEMLSEELYERFVAEDLVRRARKSKPQPTLGIRPPAFEKVWAARDGKETSASGLHPSGKATTSTKFTRSKSDAGSAP